MIIQNGAMAEMKRIILRIPEHPGFEVVRDLDGKLIDVFAAKERDGERSIKIGSRTLRLHREGVDNLDGESYEVWSARSISG